MAEKSAKITMLGTGSALVTKCFNTCFILDAGEGQFLVDAGGGNGVLTQFERLDVDIRDIHYAFLTHGHTDHILGMIWVVRKIAQMVHSGDYAGTFTLYGNKECVEMLNTFCRMTLLPRFYAHIGNEIRLEAVESGEKREAVGCEFTFFDIGSTKTAQFGFTAILPDGRKLVCLGDEPYNEASKQYVMDSDWLLSEAFCLYEEREIFKPYEKHHSAAMDAAKVATELRAKNLLLYHTEDSDLEHRAFRYVAEASQYFSGKVEVPSDLEVVTL